MTNYEIGRTLRDARRMYAAGHTKEAGELVRQVFVALQKKRHALTAQYAKDMREVLDTMEEINVLASKLVEQKREKDSGRT